MKLLGMMIGIFGIGLLLGIARADDAMLIKDMEALRNSLPFRDPGRPTLTRRLADLCFQKAVTDDKNLILTGTGDAQAIRVLRERAARLYQEALDGEKGTFPVADGVMKSKIQFQLARLDRLAGKRAQALATLQVVAAAPASDANLKREALMTIAEMREEDGQWRESLVAYQAALPLCQGAELVSYVQYRIAWGHFRLNDLPRAQEAITQALWDGQGRAKDQVVADYIQFLAATPGTDGKAELVKIEALAQRARLPQLIEDLGNAFFAGGNRVAGVTVIAHEHRLRPGPFHAARLAEEYYGFRQWDEIRPTLASFRETVPQVAALDAKKRETVDQIMRRLVVQLDGERKSNQGRFAEEVCVAIDAYLAAFPASDIRLKMQEGWLAAQTDDDAKLARLAEWVKSDVAEAKRWHQARAAIAVKRKDHALLRTETLALVALSKDEPVHREWSYVAAKAAMDAGDETVALTEFQMLARVEQGAPDKWAIQSQHLALDLLNRKKDFAGIAAQAQAWTNRTEWKQQAALTGELATMEKVRQEALFEAATSQGETTEALAQFTGFCVAGQFTDKSCPNARVLAVKLKRQEELVRVLEAQKDEEALVAEYERMGRFGAAAALLEKKLSVKSQEVEYLKTTLLYEIAGDKVAQARVSRALAARLQKQKQIAVALGAAAKSTFVAAGLTSAELMRLPWDPATKLSVAIAAEEAGKGDAQTRALVGAARTNLGPVWAKLAMERLEAMDAKQRAVGFYGGNSEALFKRRMNLLGAFATETKMMLPEAGHVLQAYWLGKLAAAYAAVDAEILATPIPAGVPADQVPQVHAALEQLAAPLRAQGLEYANLRTEPITALGAEAAAWEAAMAEGAASVHQKLLALRQPAATNSIARAGLARDSALAQLARDPADRTALEALRDDHAARHEPGPTAYFNGRLAESEKL